MAIRALNSIGGFSVGEIAANIILANGDITSGNATFTGNVSALGVKSDNFYYANGAPLDFQQPAGSNTQLQFNNNSDFGASANLTFDTATNLLTIIGNITSGNANLGNLVTANFVNVQNSINAIGNVTGNFIIASGNVVANNIQANSNITANGNISGTYILGNGAFLTGIDASGIQNGTANVRAYLNGNVTISAAGNANIVVVTGTGANINGTLAVTGNLTVLNANLGNLASANYITVNNDAEIIGNLTTGNANLGDSATANYLTVNNDALVTGTVNAGNFIADNLTTNRVLFAGADGLIQDGPGFTYDGSTGTLSTTYVSADTANITNAVNAGSANVTGTVTAGAANITNAVNAGSANIVGAVTANTANIANVLTAGSANVTGNLKSGNANLGNLATANYVTVNNNANVTGNLSAGNANLGNAATANYVTVNNTANVTGNLTAGNLITTGVVNAPTLIQNDSTYSVSLNLNSGSGILEANVNGNTTQFLPSGPIRLASTGTVMGGQYDGSQIRLTDFDAKIAQLRGGAVSVLVGDGGTVTSTWVFDQDGSFTAPGEISTAANINAGNANLGNLTTTNYLTVNNNANVTGNLTTGNANLGNLATTNFLTVGTNATITGTAHIGNIRSDNYYYANGAPIDFQQPAGSNSQIQFNNNDDFGASANFTFDNVANTLSVTNIVSSLIGGTLTSAAQPNVTSLGRLTGLTVGNASSNTVFGNGTINAAGNITGANLIANVAVTAPSVVSGNSTVALNGGNVEVGANGVTVATFTGSSSNTANNTSNIAGQLNVSGNVTAPYFVGNLTGNFAGNITVGGSNTEVLFNDGGLANANAGFTFDKVTGQLTVSGDANVTTLNAAGDVSAAGDILGNNITVTNNANAANVNATTIVASGNVTANNVTVTTDVNVTGNITIETDVITDTVVSRTGNLSLTATGSDSSINLTPTGAGTVNVNDFVIRNVAVPVEARDAATKEYVDNAVSAGLHIHQPVLVLASSPLNATYAQGGTTVTVTAISADDVLTTSATHGLVENDMVVFASTANGLTASVPYFVYTTPTTTQFTLSLTYNGPEIITLTAGTGLTLSAKANSGVGATLTNAGTQAALDIDGVSLSIADRVMVDAQSNAAYNGVYVVTTVGSGSSNWVLTRSSDQNVYGPNTPNAMGGGDYFFVQDGDTHAGSSYVLNTPGVIIIGTTDIDYAEFSNTQVYEAGTGLTLTGTSFSITDTGVNDGTYGNGDSIASFIVNSQGQITFAENVVSAANAANLTGTTLNSGIVTSSLTSVGTLGNLVVTGNTTSGNFVGRLANGTSHVSIPVANSNVNISVDGSANVLIITTSGANVAGTFDATGNISGLNITTGGNVAATGNVIANNLTANSNVTVTNTVLANTLKANGNVIITNVQANANITANNTITGNFLVATSNVSANIVNANVANVSSYVTLGNTAVTWGTQTTNATTPNQTIAAIQINGSTISGIEFLVKSVDSAGAKYSMATIQAVTDGSTVDYATFGTVRVGGTTGSLAVNVISVDGNASVALQVTPSSSNATVWTTQFRVI